MPCHTHQCKFTCGVLSSSLNRLFLAHTGTEITKGPLFLPNRIIKISERNLEPSSRPHVILILGARVANRRNAELRRAEPRVMGRIPDPPRLFFFVCQHQTTAKACIIPAGFFTCGITKILPVTVVIFKNASNQIH